MLSILLSSIVTLAPTEKLCYWKLCELEKVPSLFGVTEVMNCTGESESAGPESVMFREIKERILGNKILRWSCSDIRS